MNAQGKMPLVSAIMPAYNGEKYIKEAVESVFAQTYPNIELIVVDDGSTDSTPDILRTYGDRLTYVRQENQGPSSARNTGINLARGELVAFIDDDDRWLPGKLRPQVALFDEFPELVLVAGNNQHFGEGGLVERSHISAEEWETFPGTEVRPGLFYVSEPLDLMLRKNLISCGSVLVRRDEVLEVEAFDTALWCVQDYDLWLRLSARGPFAFERRVVYLYRQHSGQLSRHEFRRHREKIQTLRKALAQQRLTFNQRQLVRRRIAGRYKMLGDLCMKNNDLRAARAEYAAALGTQIRPRAALLFLLSAFMSLNPFRTLPATATGTSGASAPATNVEDSANGTR